MPKKIKLSVEHAKKCADCTRTTLDEIHKGLHQVLDIEIQHAIDDDGAELDFPDGTVIPNVDELDDITPTTHRVPSVGVIIAYIIKNHTKPSEITKVVSCVMSTLGVEGSILGVDRIIDDISKRFDV